MLCHQLNLITFNVDTSGILNAMPSTGPCGIETFYVDTSGILNAMPSIEPCGIEMFYISQILNYIYH